MNMTFLILFFALINITFGMHIRQHVIRSDEYIRQLTDNVFVCNSPSDCNYRGVCNQEGTVCICDNDYYTSDNSDIGCNMRHTSFGDVPVTITPQSSGNNFTCTFAPTDCDNNGVCNQAGTACICDDGYTTHDSTDVECNYKKKSGLVAFLLALFLPGTGAPYWYLQRSTLALLQLFFAGVAGMISFALVAGISSCCLLGFGVDSDVTTKCYTFMTNLVLYSMTFAMIIWWLIALIQTAKNEISDSNGIYPEPM